jgi:hypothetical protein
LANTFQPVQLSGYLTKSDHQADPNRTFGLLTAIIAYHTPYYTSDGSPAQLKFALGNDVSVNTILEYPTLKALNTVLSLGSDTLFCGAIKTSFKIVHRLPRCGLAVHAPALTTTAGFTGYRAPLLLQAPLATSDYTGIPYLGTLPEMSIPPT